jgi:preprotein translocase subunit SecE
MTKMKPIRYLQEIKSEITKVTWPTKRETTVTSLMVLVFVFVAAIFFLISDRILSWIVSLILGIGG